MNSVVLKNIVCPGQSTSWLVRYSCPVCVRYCAYGCAMGRLELTLRIPVTALWLIEG